MDYEDGQAFVLGHECPLYSLCFVKCGGVIRVHTPLKQLALAFCTTAQPLVPPTAPIGARTICKGAKYVVLWEKIKPREISILVVVYS